MMTAAWVLVAVVALIMVGPTLLDILDASIRSSKREARAAERRAAAAEWDGTMTRSMWLAIGLFVFAVGMVIASFMGAFNA